MGDTMCYPCSPRAKVLSVNKNFDNKSSFSEQEQLEHPSWVGKWRELKQMVAETQEEGIEVFI
jgi:hypothetical protein